MSTAGKSEYARVLGLAIPQIECILKCGRPAGSVHCDLDLKCRIMKKMNNVMTDEKQPYEIFKISTHAFYTILLVYMVVIQDYQHYS